MTQAQRVAHRFIAASGWHKSKGEGFEVDEYSHPSGARLVKIKTRGGRTKDWELHHVDGHVEKLGPKATFDHAERALHHRLH